MLSFQPDNNKLIAKTILSNKNKAVIYHPTLRRVAITNVYN